MRQFLAILLMGVLASVAVAQTPPSDFVEASVDHTSAYVGEPILYTWRWYLTLSTSEDTQNNGVVKRPAFDGFGQEVLDPLTESQMREGQSYQVITEQIVLYPRREGTYTLEPLRIDVPETPFAPARTLQSAAFTIDVQPLPAGAPPTFNGAVGQFDLDSALSGTQSKTGDALTLTLTLTGSGNGPLIAAPLLAVGSAWRLYPGESRTRRDGSLLSERIFTWTLVPLQPGSLTVPSQAWSFFNPKTGQYETLATQPLTVTVSGDPVIVPTDQSPPATPTLYPLLSRGASGLGMLRPDDSLTPPIDVGALVFVGLPLVGVLGVWGWTTASRRRSAPPATPTKKKASSVSQNRLLALAQKSPVEIADGIGSVLRDLLKQRRGITFETDLPDEALQGLPTSLQERFKACFEEAQSARYAPFTAEDAVQLLQRTRRLIQALEETWPAR